MIPEEKRKCFAWAGKFRWGGRVFHQRGVTIQTAGGQIVLLAVLENGARMSLLSGWGECSP